MSCCWSVELLETSPIQRRAPSASALPADHVPYSAVPRHVYVHVPFCSRRCAYCDFSIAVRRDVPVDEYLSALDAELTTRFGGNPVTEVDTIYLGGGTPSRLGGHGVARAVALVQRRFPLASGGELTIEANPEDVTHGCADAWVACRRESTFARIADASTTQRSRGCIAPTIRRRSSARCSTRDPPASRTSRST